MSLPAPDRRPRVLVTGASSGIGAELARELAAAGHGLRLVGRRVERLEALADELRAAHDVEVAVRPCDLADDAARGGLLAEIREGEPLAALCSVAGAATLGRFADLDPEREAGLVRLNALAPHELIGAALPGMLAAEEGAILVVASSAALGPWPRLATYAATKAFLASFAESLHAELRGTGVSVTTLNPGPVVTEIWERAGAPADFPGSGPGLIWEDPRTVARAGLEALQASDRVATPGAGGHLISLAGRWLPRALTLPVVALAGGDRGARWLAGRRGWTLRRDGRSPD
jgi:short-subunit dehydrogenase